MKNWMFVYIPYRAEFHSQVSLVKKVEELERKANKSKTC